MQYTLIRAHKRTLSLQVNREGKVIARAPYLMPKFLIDKFIVTKSSWINKRLKELAQPQTPRVAHFTSAQLKSYIRREVVKYQRLMKLSPSEIRFTQVNSFWGTCSPKGILSFNLALQFTPPEAVSYVVVHELAHLKWRGHGARFWDLVTKHYPSTQAARAILRKIPRNTI